MPLPSVTMWTVSYVCTEPIHDDKAKIPLPLPSQLERALWTNLQCQLLFFEEGKRSLRRLCFYTCLSVILFSGGCLGPCPGCVSKPMPRGGGLPRGVSRPRTIGGGIKARVYKNCYLYHHCRTWSDTDFDTDSKTNGCIVLCKTCSHYTDNSDPYSPFLYSTGIQVRFRVCTRIRVRRCN